MVIGKAGKAFFIRKEEHQIIDDLFEDADVPAEEAKEQVDLLSMSTLSATPQQLRQMGLKDGENGIIFTVKSRLNGTVNLTGRIFLWDYTTKVVISDIDGTITRSDALGHILPKIGKDWSQHSVCELF